MSAEIDVGEGVRTFLGNTMEQTMQARIALRWVLSDIVLGLWWVVVGSARRSQEVWWMAIGFGGRSSNGEEKE